MCGNDHPIEGLQAAQERVETILGNALLAAEDGHIALTLQSDLEAIVQLVADHH